MLSVVAKRYAKALVDVVTAPGSGVDPSRALAELRSIEQLMAASDDLRNALLSPAVSPSRKRAVVAKLIAPMGVCKQVRNFVFVVIDHHEYEIPHLFTHAHRRDKLRYHRPFSGRRNGR